MEVEMDLEMDLEMQMEMDLELERACNHNNLEDPFSFVHRIDSLSEMISI